MLERCRVAQGTQNIRHSSVCLKKDLRISETLDKKYLANERSQTAYKETKAKRGRKGGGEGASNSLNVLLESSSCLAGLWQVFGRSSRLFLVASVVTQLPNFQALKFFFCCCRNLP